MSKILLALLDKCAIPIVYVQVIVLMKIVPHINIRTAVPVKIGNCHAQSVTIGASVNTGFLAHICKGVTIVHQELVATFVGPVIPYFRFSKRSLIVDGMVQ